MADYRCLWCYTPIGRDPEDDVWYHAKTGAVECADGEHRAEPVPSKPWTPGRLALWVAFGIVLAFLILGILDVIGWLVVFS